MKERNEGHETKNTVSIMLEKTADKLKFELMVVEKELGKKVRCGGPTPTPNRC